MLTIYSQHNIVFNRVKSGRICFSYLKNEYGIYARKQHMFIQIFKSQLHVKRFLDLIPSEMVASFIDQNEINIS